jgi:hypothetical protein
VITREAIKPIAARDGENHAARQLFVLHQTMNDKSNIIQFPQGRTKTNASSAGDEYHDFEAGVDFQEFLDNEDYSG